MKKIYKPKVLSKVLSIVLMFSICILSLSPSAIAIEPEITPNYTLSSIRVYEYDFLTKQEITYNITIRIEDIQSTTVPCLPEENIAPNAVVPPDTSHLVTSTLYNQQPYSAICRLYNGEGSGTAFLVKNKIALTAAHCVYSDEWSSQVNIMAHPPAGKPSSYVVDNGTRVIKAIIPVEYRTTSNSNYDWAILVLENGLGNTNGTIGINATTTPALQENAYVIGYDDHAAMRYSPGAITGRTALQVEYNCDTTSGMSGSPVCKLTYTNGTPKYTAYAIHFGGNSSGNYGTIINRHMAEKISTLNSQYS